MKWSDAEKLCCKYNAKMNAWLKLLKNMHETRPRGKRFEANFLSTKNGIFVETCSYRIAVADLLISIFQNPRCADQIIALGRFYALLYQIYNDL